MAISHLARFADQLKNTRDQLVADLDEAIMTTELIEARDNFLTVDERGYYHVHASGSIEEVVNSMKRLLEKLERIKSYRDTH